jgi:hypothetical protein
MYSGIADDEDRDMADRWEEGAQMVVIFVRPEITSRSAAYAN